MRKLLCKLFDHKWQLDFPNLPRSRKCRRCGKTQIIEVKNIAKNTLLQTTWLDVQVQ